MKISNNRIGDHPMRLTVVREESGQSLVEYGFIVGVLVLAVVASLTGIGDQLKAACTALGSALAHSVH